MKGWVVRERDDNSENGRQLVLSTSQQSQHLSDKGEEVPCIEWTKERGGALYMV